MDWFTAGLTAGWVVFGVVGIVLIASGLYGVFGRDPAADPAAGLFAIEGDLRPPHRGSLLDCRRISDERRRRRTVCFCARHIRRQRLYFGVPRHNNQRRVFCRVPNRCDARKTHGNPNAA